MSPDGISIESSKRLRVFLNELFKLKPDEVKAALAYINHHSQPYTGQAKKSKKPEKTYKIKANAELFFEGKRLQRSVSITSGDIFQNDVELTGRQLLKYVKDLPPEYVSILELAESVKLFHKRIKRELIKRGVPQKKKVKSKKSK